MASRRRRRLLHRHRRGIRRLGTGESDQPPPQPGPSAILAANAHNTQPWIFTVSEDRIEVYADLSRTIGAMDPLLREMHISLGCALENLALAGPPNGLEVDVTLTPDPADSAHVASVSLRSSAVDQSPLFEAIKTRHTDRGAYDTTRTVSQEQLDALSGGADRSASASRPAVAAATGATSDWRRPPIRAR